MLLSLLCACDVHPICHFSLTGTLVPVCISALPTLFSMSSSPWLTEENLFHLSRDHFLGWLHWCGCFLSVSMGRGELWISYSTIFPMPLCCCIINISCNNVRVVNHTSHSRTTWQILEWQLTHRNVCVFSTWRCNSYNEYTRMYIHFSRALKWPLRFPVLINVWISQYIGIKVHILSKSSKGNSSLMCLWFCFVLFRSRNWNLSSHNVACFLCGAFLYGLWGL